MMKTVDEAWLFIYSLLMVQGQRSSLASKRIHELQQRLKKKRIADIAGADLVALTKAIAQPPALHRFPRRVASAIDKASIFISTTYAGDPRHLWNDRPAARIAMERFQAIPGIGRHMATTALFLLTVEHNVAIRQDGTVVNIKFLCPHLYDRYAPLEEPIWR